MSFHRKSFLFQILSLVILALILSGCIKAEEELWLNSDGSGKLYISVGLSEQLMAFVEQGGESDDIFSADPFGMNEIQDSDNPYIKNLESKEYNQDGFKFYSFSGDITDVEGFFAQASANGQNMFSLTMLENGNLLFKQTFSPTEANADLSSEEYGVNLIESALAGTYWHTVIHVKNVVSTNGVEDKKAGTVEWNLPMGELISAKEPVEMIVEYKPPLPFPLLLLIGVAVTGFILFILVAVFIMLRKGKKQPAPAPLESL